MEEGLGLAGENRRSMVRWELVDVIVVVALTLLRWCAEKGREGEEGGSLNDRGEGRLRAGERAEYQ